MISFIIETVGTAAEREELGILGHPAKKKTIRSESLRYRVLIDQSIIFRSSLPQMFLLTQTFSQKRKEALSHPSSLSPQPAENEGGRSTWSLGHPCHWNGPVDLGVTIFQQDVDIDQRQTWLHPPSGSHPQSGSAPRCMFLKKK
jgi:hypothetical protein